MFTKIDPKVSTPEPTPTQGATTSTEVQKIAWEYGTAPENKGRIQPIDEVSVYMRAVADEIFDPENWKNPVHIETAEGPEMVRVIWIMAAIIWFHGSEPTVGLSNDNRVIIRSPGYSCW